MILGDPHLGRTFIHGVPLHRRGEREKMQWEAFTASLLAHNDDIHINLGDIFDKSVVPYSVILKAFKTYKMASELIDCHFYILRGNHDASKDLERVSAFTIFAQMCEQLENVTVVTEPIVLADQKLALIPWDPIKTADQLVAELPNAKIDTAIGHWDVEFSEDNLVPTKALAARGVDLVYTGHIHKEDRFTRDGVEVVVNGSMQPYAHGEESNEDLYLTRKFKDLDKDLSIYKDKCLRVLLEEDDVFDIEIDCLQLTVKRVGQDDEEPDLEVTLGDFSMDDLFRQAFEEAGASEDKLKLTLDRYNEKRIADG